MSGAHHFLLALTVVFGVAAVVTVLFHRLRQPVVLGYVIAGLLVGPHLPVPLVADPAIVQTLSELGVVLLMFALGLEFSLRKLVQVGTTAGITAVVETSLMVWLGFLAGRAFGWTWLESLFAGAVVAISSTTIIAKAFDEQKVRGKLREFVIGALIAEDLIAILLIAVLTALASGAGLSPRGLALTAGRLMAFLVALVVLGLLVIPRAMRAVVRLKSSETTLIAAIGICFGVSLLAQAAGYSVALGAFLAGSLVSESGEAEAVEPLVAPVKDLFAAVFFVSVGMTLDPAIIARNWAAVAVLSAVVVIGKIGGVSVGAFLTGAGVPTSVQAGMSLAQIGEFSFIIAGLGVALGATREFLYPVAVSVSAVTTLLSPWLIRASGASADYLDRRLPRALQTFAVLYGSWIEGLRKAPPQRTRAAQARRLVRLLFIDALALAAVAVGFSVLHGRALDLLETRFRMAPAASRWVVELSAVLLALPFAAGVVRVAHRLGTVLASAALPEAAGRRVDLAVAPRRMLSAALQITVVLLIGAPLVAITQPFLPGIEGAVALGSLLLALAVGFWRSAKNLQGHVRAGAQVIAEALGSQARSGARAPAQQAMAQVRELMPGLGEPQSLSLDGASPAVGRSLAELNLRGRTGATVLAIHRSEGDVLLPAANEVLCPGDLVALAGSEEALLAAKDVLTGQRA
jgi:CPA2 family monovalent cation:H+ antiporter-2